MTKSKEGGIQVALSYFIADRKSPLYFKQTRWDENSNPFSGLSNQLDRIVLIG